MSDIDYRELLRKYIEHVGEAEGAIFLNPWNRSQYPNSPRFTDEEWAELERLGGVEVKR